MGVHKGGVKKKVGGRSVEVNSARLVTSEMISILKREALKMGADVFMDEASPPKSKREKKKNARRHFDEGMLANYK